MATGSIKGVKAGSAQVKIGFGGKTCDITGTVVVRSVSNMNSSISLTRTAALSGLTVSGGSYGSTINVYQGATGSFTKPTSIVPSYSYSNVSTTINCGGFSSLKASSSATGVATVSVSNNVVTITSVGTGSSTISILDGSTTVKTYTLTVSNGTISGSGSYSAVGGGFTLSGTTLTYSKSVTGGSIKYSYTAGGVTKEVTVCTVNTAVPYTSCATSITRPRGSLSSLSCSGNTTSTGTVYLGNTYTITKPTSVTANYGANTNSSITLSYTASNFPGGITVSSSNSSYVSVGTPSNEKCTITGVAAGSATVTVKHGSTAIATYTINVSNQSRTAAVTLSDVTYSVSSNIISLSGTTVTATGNSAGTTGTAYVQAKWNGATNNFCTVTVSRQSVTVPDVTWSQTYSSLSSSGGTSTSSLYLGNSGTITKPTSVTANYTLGNKTANISYTASQFGTISITSGSTGVATVSGSTITGVASGSSTITIKNNNYLVGTYNCTVTTKAASATVTPSGYDVYGSIISLNGTTITATGNGAGTTGTAYVRVYYTTGGVTKYHNFCTVTVSRQLVTVPNVTWSQTYSSLSSSGGTSSSSLYLGNSGTITKPTSVTANYTLGNKTANISYTASQFGTISITSGSTGVATVSGSTITGVANGSSTITVKNNDYLVGTYNCTVTTKAASATVTPSGYDVSSSIISLSGTTVTATGNSAGTTGTAYVRVYYTTGGVTKYHNFCTVTVSKQSVTVPNVTWSQTYSSLSSSGGTSTSSLYLGNSGTITKPTSVTANYTLGNKTANISYTASQFGTISITSGSTSVATVSGSTITGVANGSSTITVKNNNYLVGTYTCTVTTKAASATVTPSGYDVSSNIISLSGTTVTATGNSAGTTGTAYVRVYYTTGGVTKYHNFCTVTVSKQSVTVPNVTWSQTYSSLSSSGGTSSSSLYLGNSGTITKPTSVTANYTLGNKTANISYTASHFGTISITSGSTGVATVSGSTITGVANGSSTITVKNNNYLVGTYNCTVTTKAASATVTPSGYDVSSSIISLSGTTVTATGNGLGATGNAYVRVYYTTGGVTKYHNFCTVTVSKQSVTVPNITRNKYVSSISCSGHTTSKTIYLGNSTTITKPTTVTANYSASDKSVDITYSNFGKITVESDNSSNISVSGATITAKAPGGAAVNIKNNGYYVGTYSFIIYNPDLTAQNVTSSTSYSATSNIISLSGTTVTATGNSAGTTGTAKIRATYSGVTSDFCTVTVSKQISSVPNITRTKYVSSISCSGHTSSVSLYLGNSTTINTPTVTANYGLNNNTAYISTTNFGTITTSSSNSNVVTASGSSLTGKSAGSATITVYNNNYLVGTYTCTVSNESTTSQNVTSSATISMTNNITSWDGANKKITATGNNTGTTGIAYVRATYSNQINDFCTVTISKQTVTVPSITRPATLSSISCSGHSVGGDIYLGNSTTITKPSTVTASYNYGNAVGTISYTASQFGNIAASSNNTNIVSASGTTLTGIATGSVEITVTNNHYIVGTYTCTVSNQSVTTNVTNSTSYSATSNIISLSGTTVTATGNSAGTTGTAYIRASYGGKMSDFITFNVKKQSVTVPSIIRPATLSSISCSGHTTSKTIYLGNSTTITKPTTVTANYSYGTGSGTISYTASQFGTFNASVPNTNIIDISGAKISGYVNGSVTVTITNNNYKVGTYICTVSNQPVTTDVTNSTSYSATSNIISLSDTTVTATGNSAGTTGTAKIRATYSGKTSDFCTITVSKQSVTVPNITRPGNRISNVTASGGSASMTFYFNYSNETWSPTSQSFSPFSNVTLKYDTWNNGTTSVTYSNFGTIAISSSNTNVVSVSGTTLTGKTPGSSTITVTNNGYKVGTYTCRVSNQSTGSGNINDVVYTESGVSGHGHIDLSMSGTTINVSGRPYVNATPPAYAYISGSYNGWDLGNLPGSINITWGPGDGDYYYYY